MRHFEKTVEYNYSSEKVLKVFINPNFLVEEVIAVQGALKAEFVVELDTPERFKGRLEQVTPNRDPRSRSKTARSVVIYDWDLERKSCFWERVPQIPDGVGICGTHQIVDTNNGCQYHMTWDLTVKIPVIGKVMEKKIEMAILEGVGERVAFALRRLS